MIENVAHPYLHDLFRCVIHYDAEKVRQILARERKGKLFHEWVFIRSYEEILSNDRTRYLSPYRSSPIVKADAIWLFHKPERPEIGKRRIAHEIKTGRLDVDGILKQYKGAFILPSEGDGICCDCMTTNFPLFIWAWQREIDRMKLDNVLERSEFKRGEAYLSPLELLVPILDERLKELLGEVKNG